MPKDNQRQHNVFWFQYSSLKLLSQRRCTSDCTSFTSCLDVFSCCRLFDSHNVQKKPAMLSVAALALFDMANLSKYRHVDRSFKNASAAMLPNYKCVQAFDQWACPADWLIRLQQRTAKSTTLLFLSNMIHTETISS